MPVEILTGASTGTYNIDPFLEEITELQVGSYIFMDVDYQIIGGEGGDLYDDFGPALTVLTTVMSKRHRDLATLDAGMKAFATDRESVPEVKGISGTEYQFGRRRTRDAPTAQPQPGDQAGGPAGVCGAPLRPHRQPL